MEWLLLIPVTAAAIWLYAWFRPAAGMEWPETENGAELDAEIAAAPRAEREKPAAVAVLHAADHKEPSALAGKAVHWR